MNDLYKEKIQRLFNEYFNYLKSNGGLANANGYEELYKWEIATKCKGKPDLKADDFVSEITSWTKEMKNLLYVGMQPTALRHLAEYHPLELKLAINSLYDETVPLNNRVATYINTCDNCWDEEMKQMFGDNTKARADERLASDFLTCHNPQKYTFYKFSVYKCLCEYLEIEPKGSKEKLAHFYELINNICLPIYREQRELKFLIDKEVVQADYEVNDLLAIQTALYLLSENQLNINIDNNIFTDMETSKYDKYIKLLKANHNIVLTGAPGTGKTFMAKEIAKEMGAEVGFVQFHPSYDYTDFVEGLRPTAPDSNGNIGFERRDGIFKEFCKRAIVGNKRESLLSVAETQSVHKGKMDYVPNNTGINDSFASLYEELKKKIMEGKKLYTDYRNYTKLDASVVYGRIQYKTSNGKSNYFDENYVRQIFNYYKERNQYNIGDVTSPKDFQKITNVTLNYSCYRAIVQKLLDMSKAINQTVNSLSMESVSKAPSIPSKQTEINDEEIMNEKIEVGKTKDTLENKKDNNPYVFIIDEINRGEISKIFGELFFSIDPGYRGEKGRVKTQYQNLITDETDPFFEGFYVPDNVYIIGTMNDIDRSVESMDFAMRRRFTWVEVTAEESMDNIGIDGEKRETMTRLNQAIEKIDGLGKDYELGGAYFLGDMSKEERWEYKIVGLLREYLRGVSNADEKMKKLEAAYYGTEHNDSDAD